MQRDGVTGNNYIGLLQALNRKQGEAPFLKGSVVSWLKHQLCSWAAWVQILFNSHTIWTRYLPSLCFSLLICKKRG